MTLREIYNQIKAKNNQIIASKNGIYVSLFFFLFFFFISFWLENPIFKLPAFALSFYGWLNFLKLFQIKKINKK